MLDRGTMLRLAKISDANEMLQVRISAIRALASSHYPKTEIEKWCASRTSETYHTAIEKDAVLVEERSGRVVAFGEVNLECGFIEAIYVCPLHSRQGIGLRVLRALETIAAERGIKALALEASLNAVEFYRQAGYVAVTDRAAEQTAAAAAVVIMRHEIRPVTAV